MQTTKRVSRRNALKLGAAATALPLVHIRTAGAAGKLSFAMWDHWVPTGDAAMKKLVDEWAEKNKVDVRARLPHLRRQQDQHHHGRRGAGQDRARHLCVRPVDGAAVRRQPRSDGRRDEAADRANTASWVTPTSISASSDKHWMAVPVGWGSAPLTPCGRISLLKKFADIDVQAMVSGAPVDAGRRRRTGPTTRS